MESTSHVLRPGITKKFVAEAISKLTATLKFCRTFMISTRRVFRMKPPSIIESTFPTQSFASISRFAAVTLHRYHNVHSPSGYCTSKRHGSSTSSRQTRYRFIRKATILHATRYGRAASYVQGSNHDEDEEDHRVSSAKGALTTSALLHVFQRCCHSAGGHRCSYRRYSGERQ